MNSYVIPDNVENIVLNPTYLSPYMELIGSNANNLLKDLTPTGISIIHGMGGNDTIYGGSSAYAANNYQELHGDDGNDTIYAYGADSVLGGSGNDVLISMQGANILWGVPAMTPISCIKVRSVQPGNCPMKDTIRSNRMAATLWQAGRSKI